MPRVTISSLSKIVADQNAAIERLTALVAAQSAPATASASEPVTFAKKADRLAGRGFACSVNPSCGRNDLRTEASGGSHDSKAEHYHSPNGGSNRAK